MVDRSPANQDSGQGAPALPPAHDIFLHVQGGDWQDRLPAIETFVRETALAVLTWEWVEPSPTEISVVLAEDAFVRELNITYRDQPKPTNVLSFPALGGDPVQETGGAGDAPVLCEAVCVSDAQIRHLDAALGEEEV